MNTTANSVRTIAAEKEMGNFLQETSLFSVGLVMTSNTYFKGYLNTRWLLIIHKL